MVRALLACALMSACSGTDAVVVVEGAPQLDVPEGERLFASVSIDPPLPSGVDASMFEVVIADELRPYLFDVDVRPGVGGLPALELTPLCDLVNEDLGQALVPIRVQTTPSSLAEPAELTVLVTKNPEGDCAPVVQLVEDLGSDCGVTGDPIRLGRDIAGTQVCLQVQSLDPSGEDLWLRSSTDAPDSLVNTLPEAEGIDQLLAPVSFADNPDVVGAFELRFRVFDRDPAAASPEEDPAEPATDARFPFAQGAEGSFGVEVLAAEPVIAPEFDATPVPLRLWYYSGDPAEEICVSATRSLEPAVEDSLLPRTKPFLRLRDSIQVADVDELLCTTERSLVMSVSPPIDSLPVEDIRVAVGLPGADSRDMTIRAVSVVPESMGDELDCGGMADENDTSAALCTEVPDDDDGGAPVPIVFMRTATDSERACVFELGADGRYSLAQQTTQLRNILSFDWNEESRRMILADVDGVVSELRRSGGAFAWVAAPSSFSSLQPGDLLGAVGIGQGVGAAATHIAYPNFRSGNWEVVVACVDSSACTGDILLQLDVAGAASEQAKVAVVDLDGDGNNDVVFLRRAGATLTVVSMTVDWPSGGTQVCVDESGCIRHASIDIGGDVGPTASVGVSGAPQTLHVVVGDTTTDASILRVIGGASFFTTAPDALADGFLVTPGPSVGVATVGGLLMAALSTGVWEFFADTWSLRDPVVAEAAASGTLPLLAPGYGETLSACTGATQLDGVVFSSSYTSVRYARVPVAVTEP